MSTFIGNIDAKIDEKGRVFIPAVYRRILPDNESKSLVMRKDTYNSCLVLYPEHVWDKKVSEMKESLDVEWNPDDNRLFTQFTLAAQHVDIDAQGRILLDKKSLQSINADKEVVFVGMMDKFAIWDKSSLEDYLLPQEDFAARLQSRMSKRKRNQED